MPAMALRFHWILLFARSTITSIATVVPNSPETGRRQAIDEPADGTGYVEADRRGDSRTMCNVPL
jgi:hypothetical protein